MGRKTADTLLDPILDVELPCDRPAPNRPPADQVAANAEKALQSLKEQYDGLAANDIAKLQELLQRAQKDPDVLNDSLGQIFAVSHDIKGQAATFDYPLLTDVAALLCDFLRHHDDDLTAAQAARVLSVIDAHIQALDVLLTNKVRDRSEGKSVLEALTALVTRAQKQGRQQS